MTKRSIDPSSLSIPELHQYLLGSIGPRPICFASTIDSNGVSNLAPFSFFNVFSANPPILVFSPAKSGRTGATKNTHDNCKEIPEVVVNMVNYDMVQQMSLASSPYPKGVDEFVKSGFTPIKSDLVTPFRVQESPVQLECKVIEIKELGEGGGAGNLIICEVVKMHIDENIIDEKNHINPNKIDLVSRMGGNYYCRASGDALFEIPKPITSIGIGVDALPQPIRQSAFLTGNDLGQLGQLEAIPDPEVYSNVRTMAPHQAFTEAKSLLKENKTFEALCLLLKNTTDEQ
ncbi:MAG: flavin reductase (DIM6/NTAB) family NADH-FMN oxidoreductase RutF [Bacteroidia bacterium]|jgi:flavin reductase (DIM6/NTAB) family NADH-FMN oxidoreductase RutF